MRLINTTTFELQEFFDNIPHYAILSHRWEDGEVSFQDFQQGMGPKMKGWGKIKGCCDRSKGDGWQWAWVDSCCIDKTSSAELSEAINSMFTWYKQAEMCYVYLADVSSNLETDRPQFVASKWFTRGWTLQELLAPRWIEFYTSSWDHIGTKSSLASEIARATGIKGDHLFGYEEACIAQKMSWASKRKTTRVEDEAYCLMGLFNVYMPPLYGEGQHAFYRLQLEILKHSDDESIFAWAVSDTREAEHRTYGLLAPSPYGFAGSAHIKRSYFDRDRPPIVLTNKGLQIETFLTGSSSKDRDLGIYLDAENRKRWSRMASVPPPQSEIVPLSPNRHFLCMVLNCKDFSPCHGKDLGAYIRLSLIIPQFHDSLRLDKEGKELLNALEGWSRNGKLDISLIRPSSSSYDAPRSRLLLFTETVSNPGKNTESLAPEYFQVEIPSGFPYTISSIHQRNAAPHWEDITSPYPTANRFLANGDIALMFRRMDKEFPDSFALFISTTFEVYIIPHIADFKTLEYMLKYIVYKQQCENSRGDRTSQLLADGIVVDAIHKKEITDKKYTFVIRLSHAIVQPTQKVRARSRSPLFSGTRGLVL